jgi:hypothetical protein
MASDHPDTREKSKELETLYATVLVFGALTALIFTFFIRPMFRHIPATTATNEDTTSTTTTRTPTNKSFGTMASQKLMARLPSHVSSLFQGDPSSLLNTESWMISWQHCRVSQVTPDEATRKERARLLSRLLLDHPPLKGSTVILGIPSKDIECPLLKRAVYLLATYYNLVLLVATEHEDRTTLLLRLRGENIVTVDVLPDHRVVRTGSASGRVAFCRQVQRVDWVLDFEKEVQDQLVRFGYRVVLYGTEPAVEGVSKLGQVLQS